MAQTSPQTSTQHPLPCPVAIIGASLSGLSLALSLLHSGLYQPSDITIYDLRPAPTESPPPPPPLPSTSSVSASTSNSNANSSSNSNSAPPPPAVGDSGIDPSTTASGIILTPNGLAVLDTLGVLTRVRPRCWTSTHRTFRSDAGTTPAAADAPEALDGQSQAERGDKLVRKVQISGEEVYGYRNHRLWRAVLVGAMLDMVVRERGVVVRWGWRFEGVVTSTSTTTPQEDPKEKEKEKEKDKEGGDQGVVRFLMRTPTGDKTAQTAGLLVGADGIYSTVRSAYLDPGAAPVYTGTTGVLAHIRWDEVAWPRVSDGAKNSENDGENDGGKHEYERQCTLQGIPGAIFWIPEDAQGSVIMVATQVKLPDTDQRSRDDWERLARDKTYLTSFYRRDYEQWGPTGRKLIDAVCRNSETLYLWPFMRMAKLDRWYSFPHSHSSSSSHPSSSTSPSASGVVLLLGDAAHALPPSSGQGANQTLEDAYVLTCVLKLVAAGEKTLGEALAFWQEVRQERVDRVLEWASSGPDVQRLPRMERERVVNMRKKEEEEGVEKEEGKKGKQQQGDGDDMRWLYKPDWDAVVAAWRRGSA